MSPARISVVASLLVIATGAIWGLYWLPVRRLAALGLPGAWGTLWVVAAAVLLLAPAALAGRSRHQRASPATLVATALGGLSFALYSIGLVHGRVATVILLFYLTPVWSVLIGRLVLGWRMPWPRGAALLAGAAGLALVLGADDGVPLPRGLADGFGLAAGVLWSISSTGVRTQAPIPPARAAFVFALGAFAGTALMAPWLAPWPGVPAAMALLPALGWILLAGGLCWGVCMAGLMWATARLEPARVGILLMGEVLVGTASAALIAGEALGPVEAAGGVLVIAAAVLEVWPVRPSRPDPRAL